MKNAKETMIMTPKTTMMTPIATPTGGFCGSDLVLCGEYVR